MLDASRISCLPGFNWRYAWSRDGKYLALARGNLSIDAVMLTDIR